MSAVTDLGPYFWCGGQHAVRRVIDDTEYPNWKQVSLSNTELTLLIFFLMHSHHNISHSYTLIPDRFPRIKGESGNVSGHHTAKSSWLISRTGQSQHQKTFHQLTLKVLNFWKFTSYCSLKPLWSGMGEVVPARTSLTLHPPSPSTVHQLWRLAL